MRNSLVIIALPKKESDRGFSVRRRYTYFNLMGKMLALLDLSDDKRGIALQGDH
jgi:hypothetical protein